MLWSENGPGEELSLEEGMVLSGEKNLATANTLNPQIKTLNIDIGHQRYISHKQKECIDEQIG